MKKKQSNIIKLPEMLNTEIKYISDWEVMTPTGFQNFKGVKKITLNKYIKLKIEHIDNTVKEFKCSENHRIKLKCGKFKYAKQLKNGDILYYGKNMIISNELINEEIDLYDLLDVNNGNEFITEADIVSHNCAFIQDIDEIWKSAQQTLATGGKCIALSTPNGVGNWFHQQWVQAEAKKNKFNTIRLKWTVHPERNQTWRDEQDALLGPKGAAQECFTGDTLIYTINGLRRIDSVQLNDLVLTHDGTFQRVTKLYSHISNNLYKVHTNLNNKNCYVTGNHPILTLKDWESISNISDDSFVAHFPINRIKYNEECEILDLYQIIKPKNFKLKLNTPISIFVNDRKHKTKIHRFLKMDYDLGYIIGLYLAEGSGDRLRKTYSFNYETELNTWVSTLVDKIKIKFGFSPCRIQKNKKNKGGNIDFCSEIFCRVIDLLINGSNCYTKCLSNFSYDNGNIQYFSGIIDGYMLGDGMLLEKYNKECCSKSEQLINDIMFISKLLGLYYVRKKENICTNTIKKIGACEYLDIHNGYLLFFNQTKNISEQNLSKLNINYTYNLDGQNRQFIDNNFLYSKIYKEKINSEQIVYNIEVEHNHSYVTEHFVVHNCDTDFASSGNTIVEQDILKFYEDTFVKDPIEIRGYDQGYWIWNYPDYSLQYLVAADVARGDGTDYSAFHVIEIATMTQVAEYKGQIGTKEFGNLLVNTATEYNNALLVVENANIGWATLQQIIDRGYQNVYYSYKDINVVDVQSYLNKGYDLKDKADMVPGFTTSSKTRPLIISKMELLFRERAIVIQSKRLLNELEVFIWLNNKAQAQKGYNDDLVLSWAIGCWIRDTALRLSMEGIELNKKTLDLMNSSTNMYGIASSTNINKHPFIQQTGNHTEDLSWLIR